MSILKVARMGHPVLRAKAQALSQGDIKHAVVQQLIDDMIDTMIEYHGVGLAAPQIHESLRIFVGVLDAPRPRLRGTARTLPRARWRVRRSPQRSRGG